jgi:Dihydrodipicolinate reductase, N-terminus
MGYSVVHCGTGNIGATALKAIINDPELKLVGHYISTPEKAGRDSGELVGMDAVGVTTTNDWTELVDLGADCLTDFGNSIGREADAISDLVPFLQRGTKCRHVLRVRDRTPRHHATRVTRAHRIRMPRG